MPAVAQISINFGTILDVQNENWKPEEGGGLQTQIKSVNPLTLAQYCLYNNEKGPTVTYGLDDPEYLSYEGGFISAGDKVNVKHAGDLTIRQRLFVDTGGTYLPSIDVSGGAVTITGSTGRIYSKGNIEILGSVFLNPVVPNVSFVRNIKTYSLTDFYSTSYDSDAVNIADFKKYQLGDNVGATTGLNGHQGVYARNDNGVMKFRRICGGNNIRVDVNEDTIIIHNTAPLGLTIDGHGLSTVNDVINQINSILPPSKFGAGTLLNVHIERPGVTSVGLGTEEIEYVAGVWPKGSCSAIGCTAITGIGQQKYTKQLGTYIAIQPGYYVGRETIFLIRSYTSAAWISRTTDTP